MSSSSLIGQTIPNTTFVEVPYTDDMGDSIVACGLPTQHKTHDAFKGKKTVIIAVPGAFTPSCTGNHVPPLVVSIVVRGSAVLSKEEGLQLDGDRNN